MVCVSLRKGEICAELYFFCLSVFPLMGRLSEIVILSADDWVCIFLLVV